VEMRKHSQIGYTILRSIEFLAPAAEIVLCHQERWAARISNGLEGSTFPWGLACSLSGHDGRYDQRSPVSQSIVFDTALAEIRACSGTQFDPTIAEAFLSIPAEQWIAIHDSVNKLHGAHDCYDMICRSKILSLKLPR